MRFFAEKWLKSGVFCIFGALPARLIENRTAVARAPWPVTRKVKRTKKIATEDTEGAERKNRFFGLAWNDREKWVWGVGVGIFEKN